MLVQNTMATHQSIVVMNDVRQLYLSGNYKAMEDMYQHPHDLAFFHVDNGGESGSIFTAALPIEGLHCLENGIIGHCLHQISSNDDCLLLPKGRQELDKVTERNTSIFVPSTGTTLRIVPAIAGL